MWKDNVHFTGKTGGKNSQQHSFIKNKDGEKSRNQCLLFVDFSGDCLGYCRFLQRLR